MIYNHTVQWKMLTRANGLVINGALLIFVKNIKGNILRKNTDAIVVTLEKILKGQKFTSLDMIERLAIKSGLLHHPQTEHVQQN